MTNDYDVNLTPDVLLRLSGCRAGAVKAYLGYAQLVRPGWTEVTYEDIAAQAGVSRATAVRASTELARAGLIDLEVRTGVHTGNIYRLLK